MFFVGDVSNIYQYLPVYNICRMLLFDRQIKLPDLHMWEEFSASNQKVALKYSITGSVCTRGEMKS